MILKDKRLVGMNRDYEDEAKALDASGVLPWGFGDYMTMGRWEDKEEKKKKYTIPITKKTLFKIIIFSMMGAVAAGMIWTYITGFDAGATVVTTVGLLCIGAILGIGYMIGNAEYGWEISNTFKKLGYVRRWTVGWKEG